MNGGAEEKPVNILAAKLVEELVLNRKAIELNRKQQENTGNDMASLREEVTALREVIAWFADVFSAEAERNATNLGGVLKTIREDGFLDEEEDEPDNGRV